MACGISEESKGMCKYMSCWRLPLTLATLCVLAMPVFADTTRWGDTAGGPGAGSYELIFEKRLYEPGPVEEYCARCASYLEVRGEVDEVDDGPSDSDVTALAVGFRRYFFPFRVRPKLAGVKWRRNSSSIFTSFGLGGYEVDPDEPRASQVYAGWYLRAGLVIPLTHTCRRVSEDKKVLRSWFLDATVSGVYNEIETPGVNLDYTSARVGLRFIFPSKRDKERAENLLMLAKEKGKRDPCPGR